MSVHSLHRRKKVDLLPEMFYVTESPLAPKLVDSVADSAAIVEHVLADFLSSPSRYAVAVDLEGSKIGPCDGKIALVTLATPSGECFLFDVATCGQPMFDEGKLRALIEHPSLPKLWFDCRSDSAALFHHGVRPRCVVDLQVAFNLLDRGRFLSGLQRMLEGLGLLCPEEMSLKYEGRCLFAPEFGGSFDVFFSRPLLPKLVEYCISDVKYFFKARELLREFEEQSRAVAELRVEKSSKADFVNGRHHCLFDF